MQAEAGGPSTLLSATGLVGLVPFLNRAEGRPQALPGIGVSERQVGVPRLPGAYSAVGRGTGEGTVGAPVTGGLILRGHGQTAPVQLKGKVMFSR